MALKVLRTRLHVHILCSKYSSYRFPSSYGLSNMQKLAKQLYLKWDQYKYRLVPWIATNLKKTSIRSVDRGSTDKLITNEVVHLSLLAMCDGFHALNKHTGSYDEPSAQELLEAHEHNLEMMHRKLGFQIQRAPSQVVPGQQGVTVTKGQVPKGCPVCFYPGTIYLAYEPIFFQSLGNPFIFRCLDGILIDGNNRGISKSVYRSCWQRDRLGPLFTCDASWLTDTPVNPMAVGQFVNNHNKEYPANVAYQEFDVPTDFPFHLRQYIPNIFYSSSTSDSGTGDRLTRMVVLVSTEDIDEGEELRSTYFTVVEK